MARLWNRFHRQPQTQPPLPKGQSDDMVDLRDETVLAEVPPPTPVPSPSLQDTVESRDEPDPRQFDEEAYLEANPDVARAVAAKVIGSGWLHYVHHGRTEGRPLGTPS